MISSPTLPMGMSLSWLRGCTTHNRQPDGMPIVPASVSTSSPPSVDLTLRTAKTVVSVGPYTVAKLVTNLDASLVLRTIDEATTAAPFCDDWPWDHFSAHCKRLQAR